MLTPHAWWCIYVFYIVRNEKKQHFQQATKRIPKPPQWCSSASQNHLDEISFCERFFFQSLQCCCFFTCIQVVLQCLGPLRPENTAFLAFIFAVGPLRLLHLLYLHVHGDSVKKSELGICQFQITDKGYWCWNMLKYQLVLRFNTTPITMHHD